MIAIQSKAFSLDRKVANTKEQIKKGSMTISTLFPLTDCYQPFGSMLCFRWRRFISFLAAFMRKPAVLSLSILTSSINSKSSNGSLTETCKDLLFLLPVAITESPTFKWCSVCTKYLSLQHLTWYSPIDSMVVFTSCEPLYKITPPKDATNIERGLTSHVNRSNAMAIANSSTFAHPKITLYFPDSGIPPLGEGENKNRLPSPVYQRYSFATAPQWVVGFSSLNNQADNRLISLRFFYVRKPAHPRIMTGRDGGAFTLAGSLIASLLTLLRLVTPFSSGLSRFLAYNQGVFIMAGSLCFYYSPLSVSPRPIFLWRFYSCQQSRYVTVIANTEQQARELLPDAPCVFSARFRGGVA